MAAALREAYPEEINVLPPATLDARVQAALQRAQTYGLQTEAGLAGFVDLAFQYGAAFDTDPGWWEATEPLRDPDLDPEDRIALTEENFQEGASQTESAEEEPEAEACLPHLGPRVA